MSSSDAGRGEDGCCRNSALAGELPSPLSHFPCTQPQGPPVGNAMPPPPIMWQPPLINQQFIHHQSHAQAPHPQQHQQQQQYNELYYNMHPQAYAASSVQSETYSVLPVGHGNFLKVYHRTEAAPASGGANDAILYQQQFQQQQPYHLPAGQQTQPLYNSYELFSSNTLMTSPEINVSQNIVSSELPLQSPQQQPTMQWLTNNNELHSSTGNGSTTTNMIINQLVNNWSPNLTGGTYSQFSGAPLVQAPSSVTASISNGTLGNIQLESQLPIQMQPELSTPINLSSHAHGHEVEATALAFKVAPIMTQNSSVQSRTLEQGSQPNLAASVPTMLEPQKQQHKQQSSDSSLLLASEMSVLKDTPVVSPSASASTITSSSVQSPEGNKKRIVAEVKPMRMTYSDVLSKLNNQHPKNQAVQSTQIVKSNLERKAKPVVFNAATSPLNERKLEHKRSTEQSTGISLTQRLFSADDSSISQTKGGSKKPSTRDNRESRDPQSNLCNSKLQNNKQRVNSFNGSNISTSNKHSQKTTSKVASGEANSSVSNAVHKKRQNKRADLDLSTNASGRPSKSGVSHVTEKDFNGFYNVTAKTTESATNLAQNSSPFSSSTHINNCRRSGKSNSTTSFTSTSSVQNSRNTQRSSNGLSSSSSYGYSTKRGRGSNLVAANNNIRNRNLELAKKCFNTWFEYTMKVLTWLFYLVYDIVVLGFSMAYERLLCYYANGLAYAQQLRKDLRQNSNKPSFWIKNYLRRFDARFKKNSRWAFWRRFHKKKQSEPSADFYKNGRLPQTGEEAMFSLLNCKGKDAYSILGVPTNCSQEQIRKHYKKIAVLVHPDKNKQAGAEEAFKVLQRAFELIGEPENRESYDRSLDEALHAEKAWTELHDLLSQLQTKITEAANTIRCSTCGLRHPRKLTDRPHYAARECASCKIRHSAREGDIWAETTLLGLRWKYLALMEGKVYNITDWANCQKGALSHLEPNSHMVQYRIVRGAQHQQQTQQQHHHQQQQPQSGIHQQIHNAHSQGPGKYKRDMPPREASLHEFLDNLYSGQHPGGHQNPTPFSGSTRRRTRRN